MAGWSAAVSAMPIRSLLSTPLIAEGQGIGAMKVYAASPGAFVSASRSTRFSCSNVARIRDLRPCSTRTAEDRCTGSLY
ncbi:UNVERIFIED_ORG: hypothetical protein ABIB52_002988 [Arthrobacter sp. UYCu721]